MPPRLNPLGDVTVSKGFARREHASTPDAMPVVRDVIAAVAGPIVGRFGAGRRLDHAGVDRCLATFARGVDERMLVVSAYDRDVPATRARPKARAHERCRLAVSRRDDGFRLMAVWMGLTCRRVSVEVAPTVTSWTRHAAERFYLRDLSVSTANVAIGGALAAHFPMVCLAIEAVRSTWTHCDLAVPLRGGLLLGEVYDEPGHDSDGSFVAFDAGRLATGSAMPASTTCHDRGKPFLSVPCWRARTYVGPEEMRDDQVAYAAAWDALALQAGLGPDSTLGVDIVAQSSFMPAVVRAFSEGTAGYRSRLADLLADPLHARITCRTPPAPPVPYDDAAARVRRSERQARAAALLPTADALTGWRAAPVVPGASHPGRDGRPGLAGRAEAPFRGVGGLGNR